MGQKEPNGAETINLNPKLVCQDRSFTRPARRSIVPTRLHLLWGWVFMVFIFWGFPQKNLIPIKILFTLTNLGSSLYLINIELWLQFSFKQSTIDDIIHFNPSSLVFFFFLATPKCLIPMEILFILINLKLFSYLTDVKLWLIALPTIKISVQKNANWRIQLWFWRQSILFLHVSINWWEKYQI